MGTLTIHLLREGVKTADDAVNDYAIKLDVAEGLSTFGTLYVKPKPQRKPKWATFFDRYVDTNQLGQVQTTAGAYIVSVDGRFFALTFGQGRFILKQSALEERFGLLVTLNSVKQDALRSIDKRAFVDEQNSRVQTNHASRAHDFGIDIERDLVRGIVGYPDEGDVGTRFAGADSLTVSIDVKIPDLKKLLRKYLRAFLSDAYKDKFPWIDKIRQLRPTGELAEQLNELLIEKLKSAWDNDGIVDGCWLSIPDVIDWSQVHGFKFTRDSKEGVYSDLHLPGLVRALQGREPSIELLKSQYAMAVNEEEVPVEKWTTFKCLHCEIDLKGESYILSAGHWFAIDRDFEVEVDEFFRGVSRFEHRFPLYEHRDEADYNVACAEASSGSLFLMDKKNIYVGGIYGKVEFCDLYGDGNMIHVKRYGSSSVLGHLFNQGLVSGELLKSHKDYVELVNKELGSEHGMEFSGDVPRDVSSYTIVFCVVSQSKKELDLPFFAKVVLKAVCTRLKEFGYADVKIAKIACDEAYVMVQKVKAETVRKRRQIRHKRYQ